VESADAGQRPEVRTPSRDLPHRLLTGTAEPQGGDAHSNTPGRSDLPPQFHCTLWMWLSSSCCPNLVRSARWRSKAEPPSWHKAGRACPRVHEHSLGNTAYERHQPNQTPLYQHVEAHYPALVDQLAQHDCMHAAGKATQGAVAEGKFLPDPVHREFEAYLKWGRLEHIKFLYFHPHFRAHSLGQQ